MSCTCCSSFSSEGTASFIAPISFVPIAVAIDTTPDTVIAIAVCKANVVAVVVAIANLVCIKPFSVFLKAFLKETVVKSTFFIAFAMSTRCSVISLPFSLNVRKAPVPNPSAVPTPPTLFATSSKVLPN